MRRRTLLAGLTAVALQRSTSAHSSPTANAGQLLVVDQVNHACLIIDVATGATLKTVAVGVNGHEAAVSNDGRFGYVPIYSDHIIGQAGTDGSTIDVIDLDSRERVSSLDIGPVRPHSIAVLADGRLLVTAELRQSVAVIDPRRPSPVEWISTGRPQSHMVAWSRELNRAFTANVDSGTVSVLDLAARRLVGVIEVASSVQRISVSRDGRQAFTHDQTLPRLAVIDALGVKLAHWIDLPGRAYASRAAPDGRLFVAAPWGDGPVNAPERKGRLYIVDPKTGSVLNSLLIGGIPLSIIFSTRGDLAYVSLYDTGEIVEIDVQALTVRRRLTGAKGADGLAYRPGVA